MDPVTAAWTGTLDRLLGDLGVHMVFGGTVTPQGLRLRYFVGARTRSLDGLLVGRGAGLGGRVWDDARPMVLDDYNTAQGISHDYDEPVGREGLRGIAAAPVTLGRAVHGVLYAGVRQGPGRGDVLRQALEVAARRLASGLATESEVERRVLARTRKATQAEERLRHLEAELRGLRAQTDDPLVVERLDELLRRPMDQVAGVNPGSACLTARQVDVLHLVAEGLSYRDVGVRLGIAGQTVKAYMRDVNVALGAHSRHEAVVLARRLGIIG